LNDLVHSEYWKADNGILEKLCTAPHIIKMVESSISETPVGLKQLDILTVLQPPFLGSSKS
jgi:hypothetical protein